MACVPWDPLGCAADIAKSAASDVFSSIADDFGHVADSAINWLWDQTSNATAVRLGGAGFNLDLGIVATIAVTTAVGLFVIQIIASTIRRDPGGLGRAAKGLVVAFIGAAIAIGATNILLAAVDSLSAGVVQAATGQSLSQMGHAILTGAAVSSISSNPAGIIVFSLAALIAVAVVWAALTVRKVLIVISAVFAPLAFSGSLADITSSWVRRWIEVTVALIVSKLILVIIFVVGLDMLVKGVGQAGSGPGQEVTQAVSGLLVLTVAGFAPWMALKLVHWSGDHFHQMHALASASTAGAQQAVQVPQKALPWVTAGGAGGAAAAGTAAGVGAGAARGLGVGGASMARADGGSRLSGPPSGLKGGNAQTLPGGSLDAGPSGQLPPPTTSANSDTPTGAPSGSPTSTSALTNQSGAGMPAQPSNNPAPPTSATRLRPWSTATSRETGRDGR